MYTETLTFMLKPEEKAALEALAEEDSTSQASVIRRLIRRVAKERGLWPQSRAVRQPLRQEISRER
jgi:hypothetical protein